MKELISVAVFVATIYGGTVLGEQILQTVRREALAKAAHGLPKLSELSRNLTSAAERKPARKSHMENCQ